MVVRIVKWHTTQRINRRIEFLEWFMHIDPYAAMSDIPLAEKDLAEWIMLRDALRYQRNIKR